MLNVKKKVEVLGELAASLPFNFFVIHDKSNKKIVAVDKYDVFRCAVNFSRSAELFVIMASQPNSYSTGLQCGHTPKNQNIMVDVHASQ